MSFRSIGEPGLGAEGASQAAGKAQPPTARGEIWTVAAPGAYTGKPRPALILQRDDFDGTESVTLAPFTTDAMEAPLFRVPFAPEDENGLSQPCSVMVDKISTVRRASLGRRIGRASAEDMQRVNRAALVFLGLA